MFKGLISPPSEPPGEIMSFGVSPVNYSDSDSDQMARVYYLGLHVVIFSGHGLTTDLGNYWNICNT